MAEKVRVLKDESHTTRESLDFFLLNRGKLGHVKSARCNKGPLGHLLIKGKNAEMELTGATCGYSGEGPRGTASIL